MSIMVVKNLGRRNRRAGARHQVMANQGFGEVKVVQEGVKELDVLGLYLMTVEEAMKSWKNGVAIVSK